MQKDSDLQFPHFLGVVGFLGQECRFGLICVTPNHSLKAARGFGLVESVWVQALPYHVFITLGMTYIWCPWHQRRLDRLHLQVHLTLSLLSL